MIAVKLSKKATKDINTINNNIKALTSIYKQLMNDKSAARKKIRVAMNGEIHREIEKLTKLKIVLIIQYPFTIYTKNKVGITFTGKKKIKTETFAIHSY